MKIFSVYLNKDLDIEKAKIISDCFSFKAFIFSYFWALFNSLWLFGAVLIILEFSITSAFSLEIITLEQLLISKFLIMFYAGNSAHKWQQLKYSKCNFQETIIAENNIAAQKILFENFIFSEGFRGK